MDPEGYRRRYVCGIDAAEKKKVEYAGDAVGGEVREVDPEKIYPEESHERSSDSISEIGLVEYVTVEVQAVVR